MYAYEGFDYTILNSIGSTVLPTPGLDPKTLYFTTDGSGNVRFRVSDTSSTLVPSTNTETFTLTDTSGARSVNTVNINAGRFLDASGITLSNNSYTFFKNESIPPIQLVAPSFTLKPPTSIPALPPGLSFVSNASNNYQISGTPLVTVPNSNYQIIGVQNGGSKVVTTRINMVVSNERLRMNLSGTPVISGMEIGTAITPRVITSVPPLGTTTVRYSFPAFPDGIYVQDTSGNIFSNITTFTPTDPSYTMIIAGTPTSNAAYFFRTAGAGPSGLVYTVQGSRTVPLPLVENSQALTFAFGETVLFDLSTLPILYTGVAVDPSADFFRAATFFTGTDVSITNIFSPDLRSDLSLVFVPSLGRANLSGTPLTPGSGNFTVRAINANANTRDYVTPLTISNDSVTFSSPVGTDLCYNFILSRPVDQAKTGYYPSNIQFVASAASGRAVTLSAPALAGTGLSLDPSSGTIVGVPSAIQPQTDLVVTATTGTTSNTNTVKFAVLDDAIVLGDVSFSFVQNIPITPFQVPVQSTLSGRNVIDYSEIGLPNGLSINPAGVVSGTCLDSDPSGTVIITATTGFASGSKSYTFYNQPDAILFTVPQDFYSYLAGDSVVIQTTGVAYSGTNVSNYALTLPSPYGLSIGSISGLVSGVWTNSIPPNQVLPTDLSFTITAQAGGVTGTLPATLTASPTIQRTSFVWGSGKLYKYNDVSWSLLQDVSSAPNAFDIQFKNSNVDGNFVLLTSSNSIWRSTNSVTFAEVVLGNAINYQVVSSLASKPGSTTWWASGTRTSPEGPSKPNILRTDDNGLSWTPISFIKDSVTTRELTARDSNQQGGTTNPYTSGGVALKYSGGILMAGGIYYDPDGYVMLRSEDEGLTWQTVTNEFARECAYFSLDVSGKWIATGSDKYKTITFNGGSWSNFDGGAAGTIKYSTDAGLTWNLATGGFNVFGYELVYANNIWMATGVTATEFPGLYYTIGVKYSIDGIDWSNADIFNGGSNPYGVLSNSTGEWATVRAPLPIGSLQYDGSNWNVFVQRPDGSTEIRSAPTPTSTWSVTDVSDSFLDISSSSRFVTWTRPNFLRTSQSKQINIGLAFSTNIGNGPTITSPTTSSFLLYQYVPMSLTFSATGTGTIYFFVSASELPPGLTFNPSTNTISGKPASQGTFVTRVFAKDDNGITQLNIGFTVNVPRVIRKQDGAGAYTSLLRQYTEVLGAQNARDSRVLPNQERRLGEFMSPEAPDVITQPFTTTKCAVCRRPDCPTINEQVDNGDATTNVCDFIDANAGDVIDAGNAEANVCD